MKRFGRDRKRVGNVLAIHLLGELKPNLNRLPTRSLGDEAGVMSWREASYVRGGLHKLAFWNISLEAPGWESEIGLASIWNFRSVKSRKCQ